MEARIIEGFSKLSKEGKINFISSIVDLGFQQEAASYWHPEKQDIFDSFSENTITNFYLPFGIAPNFLINSKIYHIPMVVEESSVVAAASAASKFWSTRGGFHANVLSTTKKGHVHFLWTGNKTILINSFSEIKTRLSAETKAIVLNMQRRGGGIKEISLEDFTASLDGYYRIAVDFDTIDSMGANFINTVLETMAETLRLYISEKFPNEIEKLDIIMSILSNLVPECLVECEVSCPIVQLDKIDGKTPAQNFVRRFKAAVDIACLDPYRAATHNKGIMNGADAVVIATGNDFRAVEAGVHSYASLSGSYSSLSTVELSKNNFSFKLKMPINIGTVGGLTTLHPIAKRAMQILGNPEARLLMQIIASVGLANNFSAIKALVTKGIQHGHMKMHLSNILLQYNLNPDQQSKIESYFAEREISSSTVRAFIETNFPGNI